MRWHRIRTAQRVDHAVGSGRHIGVGEVVGGQRLNRAVVDAYPEHRAAAAVVGGDEQLVAIVRPRDRRGPAIPVHREIRDVVAETQAAQADSRCTCRRRVRLANERHRRPVRRDGRAEQIGTGLVGDDGVLAGGDVDAHEHRMQRRVGRRLLPRRHHEAAVAADVEVGVAQRCARPRREIGRRGDVGL